MEFNTFIRKPFTVEAVEITEDNIVEVAKMVGELRTKNDAPFIQLDRRLVPNVQRAYIGWFVTQLGENFRAYSPRVFNEQFTTYEPVASFVFEQTDDEFDQAPPHGIPRLGEMLDALEENPGAYIYVTEDEIALAEEIYEKLVVTEPIYDVPGLYVGPSIHDEYAGEVIIDDPEAEFNPPIRSAAGLGMAID